jgi:hypothetical protein
MMATLAVLEMCSRTSGSLVWIDGPGVVCRKVGPGSRPRWASGESLQRLAMTLRAAIARMTRRSLFPLWVPAIGHCLVSSLVLWETCLISTLSSFHCLSLLSRPSFLSSSIHPSRHISTPSRISLLSAPQPSVPIWFNNTSIQLALSSPYAMQDRDENAHYKSRIISVVAATGIALAWYVCCNHLLEVSSPRVLLSDFRQWNKC